MKQFNNNTNEMKEEIMILTETIKIFFELLHYLTNGVEIDMQGEDIVMQHGHYYDSNMPPEMKDNITRINTNGRKIIKITHENYQFQDLFVRLTRLYNMLPYLEDSDDAYYKKSDKVKSMMLMKHQDEIKELKEVVNKLQNEIKELKQEK